MPARRTPPPSPVSKRHPAAAAILSSWRSLTGGAAVNDAQRRTLVACSGGADSTALLLALAAAKGAGAIAHIVHDLRPRKEALADRDAVRTLAAALGVPYLEARVAVRKQPGNSEAAARRLRYAALAKLARKAKLRFIATAHHADDQLETILMRLTRGAGPAGLSGIHPSRRLTPTVTLIRPCLALRREQLEGLCRDAGVKWATDATNADTTRLRSALRLRILPVLREIAPHAASRAAESADLLRELHGACAARARRLLRVSREEDGTATFHRAPFAAAHPAIGSLALRLAAAECSGGAGLDRLTRRTLGAITRAVRDGAGVARDFAAAGLVIRVDGGCVALSKAQPDGPRSPKKRSGGGR